MGTVGVSELRTHLRAVLERVKRGEEVEITQHGEVVATLLHPSRLRQRVRTPRTKAADALLAQLEHARREPADRGVGISRERADARVADLRLERDAWDRSD